ncbi:MAG: hypothetical protein ACK551_04380 [Vampirovibrionales bacterium]
MKLGNTTFSSLNQAPTTPNNQRQGVLKLDTTGIEHTALGHFADSAHREEVMIRGGMVNLMTTIQAQLSEHSTTPHQIKNNLIPTEEVDPSDFFDFDKKATSYYDTLLKEQENTTYQQDLASEFAEYAKDYEEEAPPSKGIRIVSDNGFTDDEKVALWLHPRFDNLPPALDIHTDIVDENDSPNLLLEQQVVSRILQHFYDENLLSKKNIRSMFIYETEEKRRTGEGYKPVFTQNTISLEPHMLNVPT